MNTHVLIVVESLPSRVHGGNLVIRELTPEQKTSIKFAIHIHDLFSSVYSITISMCDEENGSTLVNKCHSNMQGLDFVGGGFVFAFIVFVFLLSRFFL
jgi:hypothetical protein